MSDFERLNDAAPVTPVDAELPEVSADSNQPETPEGWVERLRGINFSEHRTAIVVVGAAAVAAGVGAYALSRRGGRAEQFFVSFADRRAAQQGIISLGESVQGGAAVSVPVSEAALAALEATKSTGTTMKALFAMTGQKPGGEAGDFAYPLTGDREQVRQHGETARKAAGWLMDHFSRRAAETQK